MAALLEKDEHVTDALRALFAMPLDGLDPDVLRHQPVQGIIFR